MRVGGTEVDDTFAEAFPMRGARLVDHCRRPMRGRRGRPAGMTGFATSVIGCKCEAAIERAPRPRTPDGRPGIAVLLFAMDRGASASGSSSASARA